MIFDERCQRFKPPSVTIRTVTAVTTRQSLQTKTLINQFLFSCSQLNRECIVYLDQPTSSLTNQPINQAISQLFN